MVRIPEGTSRMPLRYGRSKVGAISEAHGRRLGLGSPFYPAPYPGTQASALA